MNTAHDTSCVLEIVSDTICPWCYIGKRRLDAALDLIGDEIAFDVNWRPFELNPDMPREGLNRKLYRSRKFGSWEKSLELDAQVKEAGARDGLDFHHEKMEMTPNTLASHVLVRLAGEAGVQGAVVEALFKAYFTDGRDVGDPALLADIGAKCGLDRAGITAALADDGLRFEISSEARRLAEDGIRSVPTILLNRRVLFSGAQTPELIAGDLRRGATHARLIAAGAGDAAGG